MTTSELAIYAVETGAVIRVLWGLLLISVIALLSVSIMYVLLRLNFRAARRREQDLTRHVARRSAEAVAAQEQLSELRAGVDAVQMEARRADAIRTKSEKRLASQNAEVEQLRKDLAFYKKVVDHVDA